MINPNKVEVAIVWKYDLENNKQTAVKVVEAFRDEQLNLEKEYPTADFWIQVYSLNRGEPLEIKEEVSFTKLVWGPHPEKGLKNRVIKQKWLENEFEEGWGMTTRPDGCSYHLTLEDKDAFIQDHLSALKAKPPSDISEEPRDYPEIVGVNDELYEKIKGSKWGIRVY